MTPQQKDNCIRFFKIRQQLSRSANAKYAAFVRYASDRDHRARGTTMYHGAATGRNTGKGPQPLNLLRKSHDNIDTLIKLIRAKDVQGIEILYGTLANALAVATRQMITAAPGHTFFCGDYSSIEGRGAAWETNEAHILEDYWAGRDPYIVSAANVLGILYDLITEEQRKSPGKVAELACGYGGGVAAARVFGAEGTDDEIKKSIIWPWRNNRPATVAYWYAVEDAAKKAVNTVGSTLAYGQCLWGCSNGSLYCKLPSGRLLSYYQPVVHVICDTCISHVNSPSYCEKKDQFVKSTQESCGYYKHKWGKSGNDTLSLTYMGYKMVDGKPTQWTRVTTWGGKIFENIIQASMRDILREAKFAVTKAGYKIILDVYDEILAEVPLSENRCLEEFLSIMANVNPPWAEGLPLAVDGWQGERYRKG